MATFSSLWPTVKGTDVLVWAAMDPSDTSRRMALYKNRSGVVGRMNGKQLAALNCTMESLPVIKTAAEVAAALRAGYPPYFNWNYFDFILSANKTVSVDGFADAIADINAQVDAKLSTVFSYKGSVAALTDLPVTDNKVGDVYQVQEDSYSEYVWVSGENPHWEFLGKVVDLSNYSTTAVMNAAIEVARLDAKRVYSSEDLNVTGDTTKAWFENLASKVSSGLMATNSLVIGGISTSDLPDNLHNAEIMVRVIAGPQVCYYASIFSDTGVMYQLNTSGSDYVWEKIAFNSYLTTHTSDDAVHVTAAEKTVWNNKQDVIPAKTYDSYGAASAVAGDLSTHTNDSDIHVTTAEKTLWNAKATADSVTSEASIRAQADTDLGASIQTEISNRTNAVNAEANARINAINALTVTKQFVRAETTQLLDAKIWYIVSATLTATLPEAPVEGTECKISVVAGGESTTVTASGSDTINGATTALAISTANDTVSLIYDATNHNWLVL